MRRPGTLFRLLEDHLVLKGFEYIQNQRMNRTMYRKPPSVSFTRRKIATTSFKGLLQSEGLLPSLLLPLEHPSTFQSSTLLEKRITNADWLTVSPKNSRRMTSLRGTWWKLQDYRNIYGKKCTDYKLSPEQTLEYLHKLLHDEGKKF